MATVHDMMQSYDMSTTNDQFVADGVHMISPTDTPLQLLLPKVQVGAVKYEWIEDELAGNVTLTTEAMDNSEVGMDITAGDGTKKFPEDVATYKLQVRVDQEIMLVTGISTDTLTVTRGYGSSTAATHDSGSKVFILGQSETEGADAKKAMAQARTRPANYVQTFSRIVETTGIQEAVNKLGGVTSEQGYQLAQRMKELALELEMQLIWGVLSATGSGAGDATNARYLRGIWDFIRGSYGTADTGNVDTTAVEADIRGVWDSGGVPRAIVGSGKIVQEIANLYADRIRTDVQERVGGVNITSIINPLGEGPIALVPHRMIDDGEYFMLDTVRLALGYIRPFQTQVVESEADSTKERIIGDYVLEIHNAAAHRYRYGFN